MRHSSLNYCCKVNRQGSTVFETALVMPVYLLFIFVLLEFGHAMMVNNTIRSACRDGARIGTVEGTTTEMVQQRVEEVLASAVKPMHVQVFVKNANALDFGNPPTSDKAIEELPDLELTEAETRQLFVVRAKVPYQEVAILPVNFPLVGPFLQEVELTGQAFMRHE